MTDYDSTVVEGYANRLYSEASMALFVGVASGIGLGVIVGFFASDALPGGGWIVVLVGGLMGWAGGSARANALKLQAQLALCQVQIERNTRTGSAIAGGKSRVQEAAAVAPKQSRQSKPVPARPVAQPEADSQTEQWQYPLVDDPVTLEAATAAVSGRSARPIAGAAACRSCGAGYDSSDYREDVALWRCAKCGEILERNAAG